MKRRHTYAASTIALVLAAGVLSACGPEPRQVEAQSYESLAVTPQSAAMSGAVAEGPVLDEAQIRKIVAGVQDVLDEATAQNDPEILKERLSGAALQMRTAEFVRAQKTGTEVPALEIEVNVASATVAQEFPRTLLVGSSAAPDDPALVFLFSQQDAKSDYMLENWVRVVGGESIRGVEIEAGSQTLGPDSPGFTMTPAEAAEAYAVFLQEYSGSSSETFVDEVFAPAQWEELNKLKEAVTEVGSIGAWASIGANPPTGVTLADGYGLVAANLGTMILYDRTVADSKMSVGGTAARYLDNPEVIGTVTARYVVNAFLLLPPEGSDEPVRVVGAERTIVSVERDDEAKPEGEE